MTFEASREIVLAMTAPQPSSNALPITLALVPGGPEPITKGLGSFKPLTVQARLAMLNLLFHVLRNNHEQAVQNECDGEGYEPRVGVNGVPVPRHGLDRAHDMKEPRHARRDRQNQRGDGRPVNPVDI